MSTRKRKQNIRLNNNESLQGLMQEAYNDACSQIMDSQKVVNELTLTMTPNDVDELVKIAQQKTNALKMKDSAIRVKVEIGKLLNDIIKHNGSIGDVEESRTQEGGASIVQTFEEIRKMVESKK